MSDLDDWMNVHRVDKLKLELQLLLDPQTSQDQRKKIDADQIVMMKNLIKELYSYSHPEMMQPLINVMQAELMQNMTLLQQQLQQQLNIAPPMSQELKLPFLLELLELQDLMLLVQDLRKKQQEQLPGDSSDEQDEENLQLQSAEPALTEDEQLDDSGQEQTPVELMGQPPAEFQ